METRYGWICPKCGRVYSPDTSMCDFCKNLDTYTLPGLTHYPTILQEPVTAPWPYYTPYVYCATSSTTSIPQYNNLIASLN